MKHRIVNYRDLRVWQHGMDLVVMTYRLSKLLPKEEQYGLTSQMRRAAVSVPSNIAEGHGRPGRGYAYHVSVAASSLRELETQFLIAQRLQYLNEEQVAPVFASSASVLRMLATLRRKLIARTPIPNSQLPTPK